MVDPVTTGRHSEPSHATVIPLGAYRPHPSVYRHLVMAAEELAGTQKVANAHRFWQAAARYRDMAHLPGREERVPVVRISNGLTVSLSGLMDATWLRYRGSFPGQSIDAEMVEAARHMLLELDWVLPGV